MEHIKYIKGDATRPEGDGKKIIVHCCNNAGAWGAGFVLAISKRWPEPEEAYRSGYDLMNPGGVQLMQVEDDILVANVIGQDGCGFVVGVPPIRYSWLAIGCSALANSAERLEASIHMPRIGCGLAGGKWSAVEPILQSAFIRRGIAVTVYDL